MSQVTKEHRTIFIALALVFLVVMVTLYLYNVERQHQEDVRSIDQDRLDVESNALEARSSGDLSIELYFYQPGVMAPHPDLLISETRSIFLTEDITLTARQIIHEVFKGPSTKEGFQGSVPGSHLPRGRGCSSRAFRPLLDNSISDRKHPGNQTD
jgi:hypothetical protein